MDTLKSVVGLGKRDQEGQEPVSGAQGHGNAAEPFDQGNQEGNAQLGGKPAQHTDPDQVTTDASAHNQAADTTMSGKSAEPSSTIAPDPTSVSAASEPETSKDSSGTKPKIGSSSWFKTALPIGKKNEASAGQATAGAPAAGDSSQQVKETESGLPPNHLGTNVPAGLSTDPTTADNMADTAPAAPASATTAPQVEVAGSSPSNPTASSAPSAPSTEAAAGEATAGSTDGSGGGRGFFSNPFQSNKPIEPESPPPARRKRDAYGSNPNAIPTAGGLRVGSVAYESRRKSQELRRSMSSSKPAGETLTEDATTSANTAANATREPVHPAATTNGVAAAPAGAHAASSEPSSASAVEGEKSQASDETPSSTLSPPPAEAKTAETSSPASGPAGDAKSRRKSIFDRVKDKLKQ